MSSDPMADYLAVLNSQLSTIPSNSNINAQTMPLAFAHAMQEHGSQEQQAAPQAQPDAQALAQPAPAAQNGAGAAATFHINGHKVEAQEGSQTHAELMKLLQAKVAAKKQNAPAAAPRKPKKPDFMEQLADALTRPRT